MGRKIQLTGLRFGRLLVTKQAGTKKNRPLWECLCDCGKVVFHAAGELRNGHSASCGCLSAELTKTRGIKHGNAARSGCTPEYDAWMNMKARCYDIDGKQYQNYGGRGIIVCDRWLESFANFLEDMGQRPSNKHSLDRFPDINGSYFKENCRWATREEQDLGKTSNKWLEYNGEKLLISHWAKRLKCSPVSILYYERRNKSMDWIVNHFKTRNNRHTHKSDNLIIPEENQ